MSAAHVVGFTLALTALLAGSAQAATYCVSTSAELVDALSAAAGNGEADEIRIRFGTYQAPTHGFRAHTTDGKPLRISGGWYPATGIPCAIQTHGPEHTVLHGGGQRQVLHLILSGSGESEVRNLSLVDAGTHLVGGGLIVTTAPSGYHGGLRVEHCVLRGNRASIGGAMHLLLEGGYATIASNLFEGNSADHSVAAASVLAGAAADLVLANNTFVQHHSLGENMPNLATAVNLGGEGRIVLANNLFSGNSGSTPSAPELRLDLAGALLLNNNVGKIFGTPGPMSAGNRSVDPQFVDAAGGNFRLQRSSPLRNAGRKIGEEALGSLDLDGQPRRMGRSVDVGAYEVIDLHGDDFEGDGLGQ